MANGGLRDGWTSRPKDYPDRPIVRGMLVFKPVIFFPEEISTWL